MSDRFDPAGEPITDDDATIAAALEDVSIPTLLLSMIHMSGDATILDGPLKPAGCFLNEVQGFMSDDDKAAVRAKALEIIATDKALVRLPLEHAQRFREKRFGALHVFERVVADDHVKPIIVQR